MGFWKFWEPTKKEILRHEKATQAIKYLQEIGDNEEEYIRQLKKYADEMVIEGPLSNYPKLARAWLFYRYEPREFRHYALDTENMKKLLEALGVVIKTEEINDQHYQEAEGLLLAGISIFEKWAE